VVNHNHTLLETYNRRTKVFRNGNLYSLTLFPTDQILLSRILADREGCYLHAGGVVFNNKGFLFVGHSEAGKSTMVTMLKPEAEVLCDDRMVLRRWPDGFKIHGTWSHGDVPDVSSRSAHLKGIFFIEKASENRLIPIDDRKEAIKKILPFLIKPLPTAKWWHQMFTLAENVTREVPFYSLYFDKSGKVVDLLRHL
jgi:hypothetical protein